MGTVSQREGQEPVSFQPENNLLESRLDHEKSFQVTTWQILRQGGLVSLVTAVPIFKWAAILKIGSALDAHKAAFKKVSPVKLSGGEVASCSACMPAPTNSFASCAPVA